MTQFYNFTEEQNKIWDDFVTSRPLAIQELCVKFKPNHLYKHIKTNQLVVINSFQVDEADNDKITLTVTVPRRLNSNIFPTKQVFGVDPDNLIDADIPDGVSCNNVEDFEDLIYG